MNINGENITLRAMERSDLPLVHQWANDPEIQKNLGDWHFPVSTTSIEAWFNGFEFNGTDQRFIIDAQHEGPIGTTNLVSINWKDRNAFTGILIGNAAHRGKGYGRAAVTALMRYAFEELGLQRLDTTIIEHNAPSLRLYVDRCGWTEEGRKEDAFFRQNQYWANVILGITRRRYDDLKQSGAL